MASSTQTKSSTNSGNIARIRIECQIPSDCHLELLDSKYLGWEKNPNILPADSIVISELLLQNLRLPLHPLYHYIFAIHDIHPLQISVNSIRTISGFLLLSLIRNLGLGVEDFHHCFSRVRYGKTDRYYFTPKRGWVWFTGLSSKVPDPKRLFLLSGNWQSPVVNRNIFEIRRDYNMAEEGVELYHPETPKLTKERVRYIRKFTVKDKNSGLHISRVVNTTSLTVLARCSPFFVMNCVGNPLLFLKDHQKLMSTFPIEVAAFSQVSSYSRGLCPTMDELTGQLNFLGIPEEDEFDKASEIIGELRLPSSTDPVSLEVKIEEGNESASSDALVKRKSTSKDPLEAQSRPSKKKKSEGLKKRTISNFEIPVPGLNLLKSISLSGSKGKPELKVPEETSSKKQKSSEPKKGHSDPLKGPSKAIITSQKPICTSTVNFKPSTLQLGSSLAPISPTLQLGSSLVPISPTVQLGSSLAPISPTFQLGSSLAPISAPKTLPEDRAFAEPSSVKEKKSFGGTSFSGDMAPKDFDPLSRNFDTYIKTISAGNFTKGVTTLFQPKCEYLLDAIKGQFQVSIDLIDQLHQRLREAEKKELDQRGMIENLSNDKNILEASLDKEKNQVLQFSEENQQLLAKEKDFLAKISLFESKISLAESRVSSLVNYSKVADREKTLLQNKIADVERRIFSAKEKECEATAQTKAKCTEVLKQCYARFSRMGVVNNCCGFRIGWRMALLPPEERPVADPDTYDLTNKITVNEYEERHYIEHEGLQIDFMEELEDAEGLSSEREEPIHEAEEYNESHYIEHEGLQIEFLKELEDAEGLSSEREEETTHEAEEAIPQMPEDLSETADPPANLPAASSGTSDDFLNIPSSQTFPSPGIGFECVAELQTPESRIDPFDQLSPIFFPFLPPLQPLIDSVD